MICPICEKRKGRRFCPAKAATICAVCCGTEREVTIDCPSDCTHLMESRRHQTERREIDWSRLPFSDDRVPASFLAAQEPLIGALSYAICAFAAQKRLLMDSDAQQAIQSLAEAYRTLSSGIYYESAPALPVERDLYDALKIAIEDYRKKQAQRPEVPPVRDSDIRDALIFMAQLAFTRSNGRPKGRAFLDLLRSQFKKEEFEAKSARLIVAP